MDYQHTQFLLLVAVTRVLFVITKITNSLFPRVLKLLIRESSNFTGSVMGWNTKAF